MSSADQIEKLVEKLEEIREEMAKVAANSRLVVSQVEQHGTVIASLEKKLTRLNLRCPLIKDSPSDSVARPEVR